MGPTYRRWLVSGAVAAGLLLGCAAPVAAQEIGAPRLDPELPLCLQLPHLDPRVVEVLWGVNLVAPASDLPAPVTVRPPVVAGPGGVRSDQPVATVPGAVRLPLGASGSQTGAVAASTAGDRGPAGVAVGPVPTSGPAGVAVGAFDTGAPAAVTVGGTSSSLASLPVPATTQLLVLRLVAGDRDPALLARLPQLPTADLIGLLPGLSRWRADERAAADLLALELLRRPETPSGPADLPAAVGLAIADALARQGDERCVGWYEGLLLRYRTRVPEPVTALLGLAAFYRLRGEHLLAATTFLRHDQFSTNADEMACCYVEAARCFGAAGNAPGRHACLDRAASASYGWAAGVARIDQARTLLGAGRLAEAIEVLRLPASGRWSERLDLGRRSLLGICFALVGQAAAAREMLSEALAARSQSDMPVDWEGIDSLMAEALQVLLQLDAWEAEPLRVMPREITLHGRSPRRHVVRALVTTMRPPKLVIHLIGLRGRATTAVTGVSPAGWQSSVAVSIEGVVEGAEQMAVRIDNAENRGKPALVRVYIQ
ncbi:MAG: hypothetical protein IT204_07525 [Fimbriimonadaceae bacterium]|nr:hypothetical protein [Fimbriimonadaceae bacterium]